jgi:hypothetical protein
MNRKDAKDAKKEERRKKEKEYTWFGNSERSNFQVNK